MQLLPFSVQFNRATMHADEHKIEASLALVNFIRNNLELRGKIKNWNKMSANELADRVLEIFEKEKFKRLRTLVYDKLHRTTKQNGALVSALYSSECDFEVKGPTNGVISYYRNGTLVKEVKLGEPYAEGEFEE